MKKLFNMPPVYVPDNVLLEMVLVAQQAAIEDAGRRLEATKIIDGHQLKDVVFAATTNTYVEHKLARAIEGYIVTRWNAAATIHEIPTVSPYYSNLTITLYASAAVTVDLWVF